jgi:hypothetical protein
MNITINIPENSVDNAVVQGKKITVYFPVQETTIVTVLEKGVLFGIQGAQGIQGDQGIQGPQGIQGIPGIGIASGGSIGQVLKKASATDYDTSWLTLDKTAVGLSNVDNTSDLLKPISTATQTALNGKQGLNANLTSISALTFASTSFVKMTAAGTFALDTNTYLTAEADTLASVTGRGNTTTNAISVGSLVANGSIQVGTGGGIINNPSGSDFSLTAGGLTANFNFFAKGPVPLRIFGNNDNSYASFNFNSVSASRTFLGYFADWTGSNYRARSTTAGVLEFNNGVWTLTSNTGLTNMSTFTPTVIMTVFSGGNIGINETTDSGFRLDVNGTTRFQGVSTFTGSTTAASAIARGSLISPTLVASANGDNLVGLDIAPTFTIGAFTGVNLYAIRVGGTIVPSVGNAHSLGNPSFNFTQVHSRQFLSSGANGFEFYPAFTVKSGQWFSTGNLLLQNGGTFTDAGYRLDVNGTARVRNVLTLGSLSADPTGANGMIYYNTTSNVFRKYINGAWANL